MGPISFSCGWTGGGEAAGDFDFGGGGPGLFRNPDADFEDAVAVGGLDLVLVRAARQRDAAEELTVAELAPEVCLSLCPDSSRRASIGSVSSVMVMSTSFSGSMPGRSVLITRRSGSGRGCAIPRERSCFPFLPGYYPAPLFAH